MKSRSMSCAVGGIFRIHLSHVQFEMFGEAKVLYLCMVRNSKPKRNGACDVNRDE